MNGAPGLMVASWPWWNTVKMPTTGTSMAALGGSAWPSREAAPWSFSRPVSVGMGSMRK